MPDISAATVRCHCERCGYDWTPLAKTVRPRVCAKCRSYCWDKPRKEVARLRCEICGKERRFDPTALKRTAHHFCSRACYGRWRKGRFTGATHWNWKRQTERCVVCGAEVHRYASTIADHPEPTCSPKCRGELVGRRMAGEKHPNWKGGTKIYHGEGWPEANRAVRMRENNTCQRCGRAEQPGEKRFDVHHKVARREGGTNDLANLQLLCGPCHIKTEWEEQKQRGEPPRGPFPHVQPGPQERVSETSHYRRLRPTAQ